MHDRSWSPGDAKEREPKELARKKQIAILQSAYVPWEGFFDLINRCDEYVILDSVQFSLAQSQQDQNAAGTGSQFRS
jgi:hypothetical protein